MINNISFLHCRHKNYAVKNISSAGLSFRGSLSDKLISGDAFTVKMKGYDDNKEWAKYMSEAAELTASRIKNNESFSDIINFIKEQLANINEKLLFSKRLSKRSGAHKFNIQPSKRGAEYHQRYLDKIKKSGSNIFTAGLDTPGNANTCLLKLNDKVEGDIVEIIHQNPNFNKHSNVNLAKEEFEKLQNYKKPTEADVNHAVATIHWLISQEMPYDRGSESTALILTKGIYLANDMKVYPLKTGISPDFEAFDTNLQDYIQKYPDFFEKPPIKII